MFYFTCNHGLRQVLPWRGLSVCVSSITLVHRAKAVARNKMPFVRDICVVPCNIVLNRGAGPHGNGRHGGSELHGYRDNWNPGNGYNLQEYRGDGIYCCGKSVGCV